ncbi:MAG: MFS transporter [Chloroflexota bacterium]|nr:MFS transporter [Chloroflexota bacterium]MEE3167398.1 MFS transporter [Chloroflexota bacterium]
MVVWLFSSVSSFMVLNTLGILLPAISADLDLSPSQQGLLGSASHWGNIALAIPLSWATSRLSPKWLTAATLLVATGCLFLQSWAPVFIVLLAGRLMFGISNIAQMPARALLTRQWFPPREVIYLNGLSNVLFGLVVGGGLVLAPVILDLTNGDWRATLRIFGLYFAGITLLWTLVGRERTNVADQDVVAEKGLDVLKGALGHRDLWIGGLGFAGATMSFGAFLAFYPTLMLEEFDISLRLSGMILALGVVVGGIGGIGIAWAASTHGREGNYLQVLGILMICTNLGMVLTGSVPALFVLSFFNGVAWAFFPILVTIPFHLPGIRPRELAVAFAFTMMSTSVGTSLGPLFTGYLQEGLDDLKMALFLISFTSISLILAGSTLRFRSQRQTA